MMMSGRPRRPAGAIFFKNASDDEIQIKTLKGYTTVHIMSAQDEYEDDFDVADAAISSKPSLGVVVSTVAAPIPASLSANGSADVAPQAPHHFRFSVDMHAVRELLQPIQQLVCRHAYTAFGSQTSFQTVPVDVRFGMVCPPVWYSWLEFSKCKINACPLSNRMQVLAVSENSLKEGYCGFEFVMKADELRQTLVSNPLVVRIATFAKCVEIIDHCVSLELSDSLFYFANLFELSRAHSHHTSIIYPNYMFFSPAGVAEMWRSRASTCSRFSARVISRIRPIPLPRCECRINGSRWFRRPPLMSSQRNWCPFINSR